MEKMMEDRDAGGQVVVVDVIMGKDVGWREEVIVYRQTRQILPRYQQRRRISGKEREHMLSVSQYRYTLHQYTTCLTLSARHDGKMQGVLANDGILDDGRGFYDMV